MHILRCDDKTSPRCTYSAAPARGLPSKGEMRRKSDNALLITMKIKHPPDAYSAVKIKHPPSPLQRGRRDVKAITLC